MDKSKFSKALNEMWDALNPILTHSSAWRPGVRFSTDPDRGRMRVFSQEAILCLYRGEACGDCFVVIPDIAGFETFGISCDRSEGIEAFFCADAVQ